MFYGRVRGLLELKNLARTVRFVGFHTLARNGENIDDAIEAQIVW